MSDMNIVPAIFFSLFIPLLMMLISIYHITKKANVESILLVIGSIVAFITSGIFNFLPYYMQSRSMSMESTTMYYTAIGIVSFVGNLLFATGFLLLVLRSHKSENIKSI